MTTLLVDADILVYRAAAAQEVAIDWGDGECARNPGDPDQAYDTVLAQVDRLKQDARAKRAVLCVSGAGNWRLSIWPTYKAHRKPSAKPLLIDELRRRIAADGGYQRPLLEADDILGILATHPKLIPGDKVIWSVDKDLLQIPGWHLRDGRIVRVKAPEGDRLHMMQTLTGDSPDGYPGCPGIGPKRAQAILASLPPALWWDAVVETYGARGKTPEDALTQARVARIMRATDYDFNRKEPLLWSPTS